MAQDKYIAEQVSALRELLAHCEAEHAHAKLTGNPMAAAAHFDVAQRLRAILDNVTGVETQT